MLKAIAIVATTSYAEQLFESTGHVSVLKADSRKKLGQNPFSEAPDHVQMIQYKDKPSFSAKMTPHKSKYIPSLDKKRSFEKSQTGGLRNTFKKLMPDGTDQKITLENPSNLFYTMNLYLGSNLDEFVFVPDTASNWLAIGGDSCTTCTGSTWDYSSSTTYVINGSDNYTLEYSAASVDGFLATDTACFSNSDSAQCSVEQDVFIIVSQEGLPQGIDGVLGLSSGRSGSDQLASDYLFINQLHDQGVITDKIFGFSMTSSTDSSDGTNFVDFGAYTTDNMRDESELVWVTTEEDYWWSAYISGIKFDTGAGIDDAYTVDSDNGRAYIDTSSSATYIPENYYKWAKEQILADVEDYERYDLWGYVVQCDDENLKSIQILFGDYWLEIEPANYLIPIGNDLLGNDYCSLGIFESSVENEDGEPYWVIGNAWLKGFYTIFDMDNTQIGFAPVTDSTASAPLTETEMGGTPTEEGGYNYDDSDEEDYNPDWDNNYDYGITPFGAFMIFLFVCGVIFAVIYAAFPEIFIKKTDEEAEEEDEEENEEMNEFEDTTAQDLAEINQEQDNEDDDEMNDFQEDNSDAVMNMENFRKHWLTPKKFKVIVL